LRSASALEAYRRFYVADILFQKVVEFLIFEENFPRSLSFCLKQMRTFIQLITNTRSVAETAAVARFNAFLQRLDRMEVEEIFQQGLHEFLTEAQEVLADVGEYTYASFMYHPPVDMEAEIRFHQQQEQQQQ
jgi:uncharacterized alpha-E superfamily protein